MRKVLVLVVVLAVAGCGEPPPKETPEQAAARHKREEIRAKRTQEAKDLGVVLALELQKIAVDYFASGEKGVDAAKWEPFLSHPELVEAVIIKLEDFRPTLGASARGTAPGIKKAGQSEHLSGGVVFTKGSAVIAGAERPIWIFEMPIMKTEGERRGQAMVLLAEPKFE